MAWNARVLLDQITSDERRVPRRAASEKMHARDGARVGFIQARLIEIHLVRVHVQTAHQRVFDDARLLVDFFQHEMLVAGFLGLHRVPCDFAHVALDGFAVHV